MRIIKHGTAIEHELTCWCECVYAVSKEDCVYDDNRFTWWTKCPECGETQGFEKRQWND